jgi:hypothetical protein
MGGFLAFAETWAICQQHATNGYLLIAETTKSSKGGLSKLRDVLRECYIRHSCLGQL